MQAFSTFPGTDDSHAPSQTSPAGGFLDQPYGGPALAEPLSEPLNEHPAFDWSPEPALPNVLLRLPNLSATEPVRVGEKSIVAEVLYWVLISFGALLALYLIFGGGSNHEPLEAPPTWSSAAPVGQPGPTPQAAAAPNWNTITPKVNVTGVVETARTADSVRWDGTPNLPAAGLEASVPSPAAPPFETGPPIATAPSYVTGPSNATAPSFESAPPTENPFEAAAPFGQAPSMPAIATPAIAPPGVMVPATSSPVMIPAGGLTPGVPTQGYTISGGSGPGGSGPTTLTNPFVTQNSAASAGAAPGGAAPYGVPPVGVAPGGMNAGGMNAGGMNAGGGARPGEAAPLGNIIINPVQP